MTNDDLCYLSASSALKLFRKRQLSPVGLLQALITRAGTVNPRINCFADTYFEEALAEARRSEARYAKNSALPLDGIPLAVKDAQRLKGKRTTHGSLIFKDAVDDHSDPMIERLQKAGANIFARTTVPEFCLSGVTHTRMWGITRNPWNTDWGPGGSSGGSGAALAAGTTTLATGTDIAGSIRIPAACCGVVGFKPPHGRNPDGPPSNFDRFNHCGPMTRTVADAALMQSITAGAHPLDHDSLRDSVSLPTKSASIRGMKIAWSIDFDYVEVENDVRLNTRVALEVFKSLGAIVEEVKPGWTADTDHDCPHWLSTMHFGRQTLWHRAKHAEIMNDYSLRMAEVAAAASLEDVHKSWQRTHQMYQTLGPILDKYDIFICPTNNAAGVKADHDPWDLSFTVNGKKADPEYGWIMTHPFNMLHNCPVMSVPSGHAASGVPTGIQIVGPTWRDDNVFKAALAYEKALGGWYNNNSSKPRL